MLVWAALSSETFSASSLDAESANGSTRRRSAKVSPRRDRRSATLYDVAELDGLRSPSSDAASTSVPRTKNGLVLTRWCCTENGTLIPHDSGNNLSSRIVDPIRVCASAR